MRDEDILKSINSRPEFEKPENLQHAMKAQGPEVKVKLYLFLNPFAVWSWCATPHPARFNSRKLARTRYMIG